MQTRIIIHRAYKGNELLSILIEVAGRLIGFPPPTLYHRKTLQERSAAEWASISFITNPSLKAWKQGRKAKGATRFERVTLLGETR